MQQFVYKVASILHADKAVHRCKPFNITARKKNCMYYILAVLNYLYLYKFSGVKSGECSDCSFLGCDTT